MSSQIQPGEARIGAKNKFPMVVRIAESAKGGQAKIVARLSAGHFLAGERLRLWMSNQLMNNTASIDQSGRRANNRIKTNLSVEVRDSLGSKFSAIINDISETGCAITIKTGVDLKLSRIYCLKLKDLEIQAGCTAWTRNGEAGFSFVSPLSTYVVEYLVSSSIPPED